jgi:hypothetical protein
MPLLLLIDATLALGVALLSVRSVVETCSVLPHSLVVAHVLLAPLLTPPPSGCSLDASSAMSATSRMLATRSDEALVALEGARTRLSFGCRPHLSGALATGALRPLFFGALYERVHEAHL